MLFLHLLPKKWCLHCTVNPRVGGFTRWLWDHFHTLINHWLSPNTRFQMTLPRQYTHSSAVFLNFSAQWQKQRLWKCYKTERWAWLGLILIPKVCSNFRTCGFSCMINDWSMSEPHPLPVSFCKCTKSGLAKAIALCQRVDVVKKCIFIE